MNSYEVFIHSHQGCFAGTGAIVRLPQCQWSKPDGYGKTSQCITTTKHSKAKTVCIFLGIYCRYKSTFACYLMASSHYLNQCWLGTPEMHHNAILLKMNIVIAKKSHLKMIFQIFSCLCYVTKSQWWPSKWPTKSLFLQKLEIHVAQTNFLYFFLHFFLLFVL